MSGFDFTAARRGYRPEGRADVKGLSAAPPSAVDLMDLMPADADRFQARGISSVDGGRPRWSRRISDPLPTRESTGVPRREDDR